MSSWPDPLGWTVLVAGALAGSVVGGVAGFGAGVILLPLIAWSVDIRATAPVLTVSMLLGNLSRVWWNRREIDGRAVAAYLAGAVPATAAGAMLYAGATGEWLRWIVGGFLVSAVPLRRLLACTGLRVRLAHLPLLGIAFGTLSAIVVTIGPVVTPFFLAFGLRRGAFVATEGACAVAMHVTRGVVFSRYALLTWPTVALGLVLGTTMVLGSWIARRLLERMSDRLFLALVEALLVLLGLQFLLFPG